MIKSRIKVSQKAARKQINKRKNTKLKKRSVDEATKTNRKQINKKKKRNQKKAGR